MAESDSPVPYVVLARKYRPQRLSEVIGQPGMVKVITNAFAHDRMAHAFILTGVRGVGKTTTARIIAKGLNCIGEDGNGGPTTEPCGSCLNCRQINSGSHLDILELDAASRTGVDDVREIIDSVAYRAAVARFKVYIIDEVHMLSRSAFNALLKTLEEPPPHVKFIFATTEISRVPSTVLSRCQRFDLRRIDSTTLAGHLEAIATREQAEIGGEALQLIIRAAEGSVRDAISLLDQAISFCGNHVTAEQVREMLALADRSRVLDLMELIMAGDAGASLDELADQYRDGADPEAVLRDLADTIHWLSVAKFTRKGLNDLSIPPATRERGKSLGSSLSMATMARAWQILLKCIAELAHAPDTMAAAEMTIIRLCCAAEMPTPEDLVKLIENAPDTTRPAGSVPGKNAPTAHQPVKSMEPDRSSQREEVNAPTTTVHKAYQLQDKKVEQDNLDLLDNSLVQSALQAFPSARVMVGGKQIN